jgi:hypothetical protein
MLICGDFNINYLEDNKKKQQLNDLLRSFNLHNVLNFPTKFSTTTQTLIDNIFIDITKFENYTIFPASNAELLFLYQQESHCTMTNPNYKIFLSLDKFKL